MPFHSIPRHATQSMCAIGDSQLGPMQRPKPQPNPCQVGRHCMTGLTCSSLIILSNCASVWSIARMSASLWRRSTQEELDRVMQAGQGARCRLPLHAVLEQRGRRKFSAIASHRNNAALVRQPRPPSIVSSQLPPEGWHPCWCRGGSGMLGMYQPCRRSSACRPGHTK